jgi:RNA polymerase sigma-70 factor (ECF subfamily)
VSSGAAPAELADDLFRRESVRLVAALTRLLGPANVALAEDVVQDALVSALEAWRFGPPSDPRAWIFRAARNRAIDLIRRDRRLAPLPPDLATEWTLTSSVEDALAPSADADAKNQLAMMFACCVDDLGSDTHVTLILRYLVGLGPREIARAFLVDVATVDRRLHRGRERLAAEDGLVDVRSPAAVAPRLPSVLRAIYLVFSEGYHGSDPDVPLSVALSTEARRVVRLLLATEATATPEASALAALIAFDSARLATRIDGDGVFVPLAEQDRARWDRSAIEEGMIHLAASATGAVLSRYHLEAGIACEHAIAPSLERTNWRRIRELYDALAALGLGPVVLLNRALAVAEADGLAAGREALAALDGEAQLERYPFAWAARADLARRAGDHEAARRAYAHAIELSRSDAERRAYERRVAALGPGTGVA